MLLGALACGSREPPVPNLVRLKSAAPPPAVPADQVLVFADGFETELCWVLPDGARPESVRVADAVDGNHVLSFSSGPGAAAIRIPVAAREIHRIEVFGRSADGAAGFRALAGHTERPVAETLTSPLWMDRDRTRLAPAGTTGGWTRLAGVVRGEGHETDLTIFLGADRAGVEFDAVRVSAVGPRDLVATTLARHGAHSAGFRLGDVFARRVEPLPPGGMLEYEVRIPRQNPRLYCEPVYLASTEQTEALDLLVTIVQAGREQQIQSVALQAWDWPAAARFQEIDVPLPEWAGAAVKVRFTARLRGPPDPRGIVLLGSPLIRGDDPGVALPNIILVSIDALRADHVSAYGSSRPTTPFLDRLAAAGTVVENACATSTFTLPSHASMFTGQTPTTHGANDDFHGLAPEVSPLLTGLLADAGYLTIAATGGGYVHPNFGFGRGFDLYSIADPLTDGSKPSTDAPGGQALAALLAHAPERPLFLFLHTYAVHDFGPAPEDMAALGLLPARRDFGDFVLALRGLIHGRWQGVTPEAVGTLTELYDGAIRGTDRVLAAWFDRFRELGLLENSIVIVTSDHGEEFLEHGALFHRQALFEETVRVPLIFQGRGIPEGRRVSGPVSLVDLHPTLAGLIGLPVDARVQGQDLSAHIIADGEPRADVFAELRYGRFQFHSLRNRRYKAIAPIQQATGASLFDLRKDPLEREDIAAANGDIAGSLTRRLAATRARDTALRRSLLGGRPDRPEPLDPEVRKQLLELGYVAGSGGN